MRNFATGQNRSQILKSARASFIQHADGDGKEASPAKAKTAVIEPPPRVPSTGRDSADEEDSNDLLEEEVYEVKDWEEPPPPTAQADRKTSYVRLPGAYLNDEEDEVMELEKERRGKEMINYLQEKWAIHCDKTSSGVDIQYRTVDMLIHQPPANHWLLKRARQKIAEHTGFFSNVRNPYEFLGVPEMDNDMVLFRNLPAQVKISADEWIDVHLRRENEKAKRNARLPHLPHVQSRRSVYTRGRIKAGAGGIDHVEQLIKTGEGFQRDIRGPTTFTKLISRWFQGKEEELANRGSPFGQVKRSKVEQVTEAMPDLTGSGGGAMGLGQDDDGKRVTQLDDKLFQEFLNLEKMIMAIYNLVKSMMNIKIKQINSPNRIPLSAVMELRSRSPRGNRNQRDQPPVKLLDNFNQNTGFYAALSRGLTHKAPGGSEGANPALSEFLQHSESDFNFPPGAPGARAKPKPRVPSIKKKMLQNKYKGSGRRVPKPFDPVTVGEIYPLSEASSEEDLKVAVDRVQKIIESSSYLDDRPFQLKSPGFRKERAFQQAERNRRHYDRFRAMFHRHERVPEPIWWNVYVRNYKKFEDEMSKDLKQDSRKSLLSIQGLEISNNGKIPDLDDIPTPNLPGAPSIEKLSSEEQSRLNLLTIVPGATHLEVPSPELRKLYDLAGVKTMDKHLFQIMMSIKRPFRVLEKRLRVNSTNKVEKFEWDTPKRYKAKIAAHCAGPIFENAIGNMRYLAKLEARRELDDIETNYDEKDISEKQPAPWFRDLIEICDQIGALKHNGVSNAVHQLLRFCDVNSNSKPFMLRRFCLLVISLPANEIAAPYFQKAIAFLLDKLFGAPGELLQEWLQYRGLKPLIT